MPDWRRSTRPSTPRQPLGEQRVAVEGAVEAGHPAEQARVVLVPGDALTGGVGVRELVDRRPHRGDQLEPGHHGGRALLLREHGGGFGREREGLGRGVVGDVAVGRLRRQPLLHVARGDARALRELGGGGRLEGRQRLPQTEAVAEVDEDCVVRRGLVGRHLSGELLEPAEVEDGCVELGGHGPFLSLGRPVGAFDDDGRVRGCQRARTGWSGRGSGVTGGCATLGTWTASAPC